jgi:hypothetical protein
MKAFVTTSEHGLAVGGAVPEEVYFVAMETLKMSVALPG